MSFSKISSNWRKLIGIFLPLVIFLFLIIIIGPLSTQNDKREVLDRLDMNISEVMNEQSIPGVAACAIKNGKVVWMESYGHANIEQNIAVTLDTLFMLGSVSKIITGIAFMQLYERDLIDLDDDINEYLPFKVIHPDYPNTSITSRMLLSHVSGIHDNWNVLYPLQISGMDSPHSLEDFTLNYLTINGTFYQSMNYNSVNPGTVYDYTNMGSTLIAYLVEVISNDTFEEYCQKNIFVPLGMNETSWFLANLDIDSIAIPYTYTGSDFFAQRHYSSPVYPCGFLRTSVRQQANLLTTLMEGGTFRNRTILNKDTLELMMTHHYPDLVSDYGLFFQHKGILWGHNGGGPGVATRTFFYPEANEGVIIMLNVENSAALNEIHNAILACMRTAYSWLT